MIKKNSPSVVFIFFYLLGLTLYLTWGTSLFFPWEYDSLLKIRGSRLPQSDIVLVTIDDQSIELLKSPWPWDRKVIAEALHILAAEKPRLIALDLLFSEQKKPAEDRLLEASLNSLNTSLPILLSGSLEGDFQTLFSGLKELVTHSYQLQKPIFNLPYGLVNAPLSPDGRIRGAHLFFPLPQETLSHFSLCAAYLAQNSASRHCLLPESLQFFNLHESHYLINFPGPINSFPSLSMFQVLRREIPPGLLRNKILLVGTRLSSIQDFHATPYFDNSPEAPRASGLEILATLIENITGGFFYQKSSSVLNTLVFSCLSIFFLWLCFTTWRSVLQQRLLLSLLLLSPLFFSWLCFTFFNRSFPGLSMFFIFALFWFASHGLKFKASSGSPSSHPPKALPEAVLTEAELTLREQEILPWLLEDLKISELSKRLHISESTLKKHINNIYQKFSVRKRSELIYKIKKASAS